MFLRHYFKSCQESSQCKSDTLFLTPYSSAYYVEGRLWTSEPAKTLVPAVRTELGN